MPRRRPRLSLSASPSMPPTDGSSSRESWRHRLFAIPTGGGAAPEVLCQAARLSRPRIVADAGDGYLLALFAPRNRLIEFVLHGGRLSRRHDARDRPRAYWIAPALSASRSFLEPLQNGGVRTMGIHKPWSPTRSYGLVVEPRQRAAAGRQLSTAAPTARRHGVTSAIAHAGRDPRRLARAAMPSCRRASTGSGADMSSPSSRCRRSPRPIAACRPSAMSISLCTRARSMPCWARTAPASRPSPRSWPAWWRQPPAACSIAAGRSRYASPFEALSDGIAMVFQETSLVPSMTVAQNIYLGEEKFLNRLRGIYIAAQQFLQSLNFTVDPTATVATPRRRQAPDGGDRPRRPSQGRGHHLRRADRLPDAGGKAPFLRPDAAAEGPRRLDRLHLATRWKRRWPMPTASPSCATASWWPTGQAGEFDRDKVVRAMVGRTLSSEIYNTPPQRRPDPQARRQGAVGAGHLDGQHAVRNNSFSIYEGQITGVFGLIGSGRTETFKIVSGIYKRDFLRGGDIELDGQPVRYNVPGRGGEGRHRLRHRGPQDRGLLRDHVDRREPLFRPAGRGPRAAALVIASREMRELAADWSKPQRQGDQRQCPGGRALRRQPAEGGDRQGPDPEAAARDLRRADPRRRCRRHRRNPPASSTSSPMTASRWS